MSRRELGLVVVFGVVGIGCMWPSGNGMLITNDGVNYLSIAENVAHGRGIGNYTGQVEFAHPFGYSLAMAPFVVAGMSSQDAAKAVNWLSLIVVGLFAFLILGELIGKRDWRALAGAVLVEADPALVIFANQVLSEAMSAALVLVFLWLCLKRAKLWQIAAAALALGLTRYTGLGVVVGAGLFLETRTKRWVVGGIPVAAVVLLLTTSTVVTRHVFSGMHGRPSLFWHVPFGLADVAGGIFAAGFLTWLVVSYWKDVRVMAGAVLALCAGVAASAMTTPIDPTMDWRLFVPISGVVVVLLIALSIRRLPRFAPYLLSALAVNAALLPAKSFKAMAAAERKVLNHPMYRPRWEEGRRNPKLEARMTIETRSSNATLTPTLSRARERGRTAGNMMAFIQELPRSVEVYSSHPALIWLMTGRVTRALPSTVIEDRQAIYSRKADIVRTGGYMVWFRHVNNSCFPIDSMIDIAAREPNGELVVRRDSTAIAVKVGARTQARNPKPE